MAHYCPEITSSRLISLSKHFCVSACFILALVNLPGCGNREPEIRTYVVPRESTSLASSTDATAGLAGSTPSAAAEPRRMLGAIIPSGADAWFFKAVGTPDNTQQLLPAFEALISSFEISANGEPTWKLPEGWQQQPASGMRYATLVAKVGEEEIATSLIKLPIFEGTWEEYCESNVNRWRGELTLANEKWEEIAKYAKAIPGKDAKRPGYWINLEGKQDPNRSMRAPMMSGSGATAPPSPLPPAAPPQNNTSPIKYQAPAGWMDLGASGMRLATLIIGEAKTPPNEVTIIPASGDLVSNVRRWQEQLTPNVDDAKVNESIEKAIKVTVDGTEAQIVHLVDSEDKAQQAILAAVIPMDSQSSLFIKYKGEASVAEAEKQNFVKFVESLRWK